MPLARLLPAEVDMDDGRAVLKAGASLTEEEFIAWAKNRMAATKYPRKVEFMAQLPITATGKILKKELARRELARCLPEPA